jgi:hypothetical protein
MAVRVARRPVLDPLLVAEAAIELAQLRRLRAGAEAAAAGRTQREIAARLGMSQSAVFKMLVKARHTRGLEEMTPWEVVLRFAAGELGHAAALDELRAWPWSADEVRDRDCPEPEQFVPWTWHDLDRAVRFGYLTDDDFDAVLAPGR